VIFHVFTTAFRFSLYSLQEHGQPPRELMAELAPNMFFNDQAATDGTAGTLPKDLEGCPVQ
jgi:hypothetical protein